MEENERYGRAKERVEDTERLGRKKDYRFNGER